MGLAGIYASRMLGLFLILPVFALYAEHLDGATPVLVGLAIGIYGLTQAVLQIPFGMLSDHLGRKPVIIGGLILFALGSVIAATAQDIGMVILGRAIQGSGAIAAAVMALLSDLTDDSRRTKAMAMIGMTIGLSFSAALILGPILNAWIGVPGIFWFTALLALISIAILLLVVPPPPPKLQHSEAVPVASLFGRVLRNPQLLQLDMGIFVLHLGLTALFLSIPLALRDLGLTSAQHTYVYLPVLLLAIVIMVPFVIKAERGGKIRQVFLIAVAMLGAAQALLYFAIGSLPLLIAALLLYFVAFNILEATLPSLVSKFAPTEAKGTAMGVYSTAQFSGAFFGGMLGGWVHGHLGLAFVFVMAAALTLLWLLIAWGKMESPAKRAA